jgi:hypothetical protein
MLTLRSEYHPETQEEGALDPLGLALTGERLALYFLPGLLERQRRIRFLTLISIGLSIKDEVESGISEEEMKATFWEAFEWNVVSAIAAQGREHIRGLPGGEKTLISYNKGLPLNADRYLVTSSVFGFHGVYKFLAAHLAVEDHHGSIAENGTALFEGWRHQQKLPGFGPGRSGDGSDFYNRLVKATKSAMREGQVTEKWTSTLWRPIFENFHHAKVGASEKEILFRLITANSRRAEVLEFLTSKSAQRFRTRKDLSEKSLYLEFQKSASAEMKPIVESVLAYELFAKTMADTFEQVLHFLTTQRTATSIREIAEIPFLVDSAKGIRKYLQKAEDCIAELPDPEISLRLQPFDRFKDVSNASEFAEGILQHHIENQGRKKKNPWFFRAERGEVYVRPGYLREETKEPNQEFQHAYRANTLLNFLEDLGK